MKTQITWSSKAHLIRGTLCVALVVAATLLSFFPLKTLAKRDQRTLTFAERVAYQRAIEEVYWRHRIWPKENLNPKPSLDAVMSQAQLEKKVEDYLGNSQALEDYWQRPINAQQLQAEMDRMARDTKQPEVLQELFEALGNDPFVIAECLARSTLVERDFAIAEPCTPSLEGSRAKVQTKSRYVPNANYALPTISDATTDCTPGTWAGTSITNAPSGRYSHTAVWTGSEMIVWGGFHIDTLNTGGRYIPSTDSWLLTSTTNAPEGRTAHAAVWTGNEMIIWGGGFNTGGRYNPTTDSWTATSLTNAPSARQCPAVWTGSEMIIWGGYDFGVLNTGGRYNPDTDTWTATSTTNAPAARYSHTAVWTGSEMIIWGGLGDGGFNDLDTGGRYNPGTDTWTGTSIANAPTARDRHTAVWTGSEMIIWGGEGISSELNTGGKYHPSTDSWTATNTNAPNARFDHTAVWTGSEMIIWGGYDGNAVKTGGRYDPATDTWIATRTTNAPSARLDHTAVWAGNEMIIWGGRFDDLDTGGRYCAQFTAPSPTPTATATATADGIWNTNT